MKETKQIYFAIIYFLLSCIITWWFVNACPLYTGLQQKLLSTGIAGAKWALQIATAYFFLENKKWVFIKNIGFTCLVGSSILLPYAIAASFSNLNSTAFFVTSLIVSVVAMIILYFLNVRKLMIPAKWFWGWICCLIVAIILQLTVVFSAIHFPL